MRQTQRSTLAIPGTLPLLAVLALVGLPACDDDIMSSSPDPTIEYEQRDRIGLPAIATVFIPSAQKDAYNEAVPVNDAAEFRDEIVAGLLAFGVDQAGADALGDALTPDILPIDPSQPTAFLNGRGLSDDVITAELGLIFGDNPALNDDNVDANDREFLAEFPYLAAPWL